MMKNIIIGHGYCAQHLLAHLDDVQIYTRHWQGVKNAAFLDLDADTESPLVADDAIIFYTVPPAKEGRDDLRLKRFLANIVGKPRHFVYFGSTGVYGNHHGSWVNEQTACHLVDDRAYRRTAAEKLLQEYAKQQAIPLTLLRIAGIYGPQRLSLAKVFNQTTIITAAQAPYSNYIHIEDLCAAAWYLSQQATGAGIINIADGHPQRFAAISRIIAEFCQLPLRKVSLQQAYTDTSPTYRQFLNQSKRIDIAKLTALGYTIKHQDLRHSVQTLLQNNSKENFICVF